MLIGPMSVADLAIVLDRPGRRCCIPHHGATDRPLSWDANCHRLNCITLHSSPLAFTLSRAIVNTQENELIQLAHSREMHEAVQRKETDSRTNSSDSLDNQASFLRAQASLSIIDRFCASHSNFCLSTESHDCVILGGPECQHRPSPCLSCAPSCACLACCAPCA